jgi:hypothetical protein
MPNDTEPLILLAIKERKDYMNGRPNLTTYLGSFSAKELQHLVVVSKTNARRYFLGFLVEELLDLKPMTVHGRRREACLSVK